MKKESKTFLFNFLSGGKRWLPSHWSLLKDAFNEAKSMGCDVKIIKHVLKLRKKDKDDLAEEDSLIELYRGALNV